MSKCRSSWVVAAAAMLTLVGAKTAYGIDVGGFGKNLFRGFEYAGNQNFYNSPQNGPLFDNNIFKQRIEWNRLGHGYSYDEFRLFGPDTYDNPNQIDMGPLKVALSRDPTVDNSGQPVGIHNKVGFTTTFIPQIDFVSQTGQRNFDQFSGQTTFTPAPVNYSVKFDTGAQNFDWTGNALINSTGNINALGFYNYNLRITNVGNSTAQGFVVNDQQVTDLDTGPISLQGNIVFDAIAGFFQTTGTPDNAIPPRIISGASGKSKSVDDLMTEMKDGQKLTDEEMQFLLQQMFLTAFKADPIGVLVNGLPSNIPGFGDVQMSISPEKTPAPADGQTAPVAAVTAPEPGTLILLVIVIGTLHAARGLGRRRLYV